MLEKPRFYFLRGPPQTLFYSGPGVGLVYFKGAKDRGAIAF
jgi:hypothetical protein